MKISELRKIIGWFWVAHWRSQELDIAWHTLVGMYDRVDLYTSFLSACFGMASHTFENGVREEWNGGGINDAETFYPLFRTVTSAVRGKFLLIGLVKVVIDLFKELFRASGIGIWQCAALRDTIYDVANSQQNVVLCNIMSFGNLMLFDTIWKRKFRILTRFFVISNHIVTWFPTKKSMDVRPSNLWSYVLIPLGRTCIHPNAVRPYSHGRTSKE